MEKYRNLHIKNVYGLLLFGYKGDDPHPFGKFVRSVFKGVMVAFLATGNVCIVKSNFPNRPFLPCTHFAPRPVRFVHSFLTNHRRTELNFLEIKANKYW